MLLCVSDIPGAEESQSGRASARWLLQMYSGMFVQVNVLQDWYTDLETIKRPLQICLLFAFLQIIAILKNIPRHMKAVI